MRLFKHALTASLSLFCVFAAVIHAAEPVIKEGACPSGYHSSGSYCVPGKSARQAIPKLGACPSGYHSSGNYCVGNSDRSRSAIPKVGACPSGYHSSGKYCLSNR